MTIQNPKLKGPGLITAHSSSGPADAQLDKFVVAWHNDLNFRQTKYANIHDAVCITDVGKDYHFEGLHLMPNAAVRLADDILGLPASHFVTLDNHNSGVEQPWRTFSYIDTLALSKLLNDIGLLHI